MKKNPLIPILLLICTWLLGAAAQAQKEQPLPKDLPPYGPQAPFRAPDVQTAKLDNGLTVWLVAQPGLPKVAFAVAVLGGMAADPVNRPGLSELLADTRTEGPRPRSAGQIAEETQAAGGDLGSEPTRDRLSLRTNVLSSKVEPAVGLLADILENASFPDSEVDLAKRNLSNS